MASPGMVGPACKRAVSSNAATWSDRHEDGRPITTNPACRQRARHARLGADAGRAALLAVAARAEHVTLALATGQHRPRILTADGDVAALLAAVPTSSATHGSVPEHTTGRARSNVDRSDAK